MRRGLFSTDAFNDAVDEWLFADGSFEPILEMVKPVIARKVAKYPKWMHDELESVALEALVKGIRDYEGNRVDYVPQVTILFRLARMLMEAAYALNSPLSVPFSAHNRSKYEPDAFNPDFQTALEQSVMVDSLDELDPDFHPEAPSMENSVIQELDLRVLLTTEQYEALMMSVDGLTVREVAQELGVSSATAHRRVIEAKTKAAEYLTGT